MRLRIVYCFSLILGVVLFSYGTTNAQVVDAVEKVAEVTKEATVETAKKTAEVTKDIAKGTKDVTVKGAKKTVKVTKKVYDKGDDVASDTAKLTKKGAKKALNAGEYVTISVWDGTEWVSKKVKKGTFKGVEKTKESVEIVGEEVEDVVD